MTVLIKLRKKLNLNNKEYYGILVNVFMKSLAHFSCRQLYVLSMLILKVISSNYTCELGLSEKGRRYIGSRNTQSIAADYLITNCKQKTVRPISCFRYAVGLGINSKKYRQRQQLRII